MLAITDLPIALIAERAEAFELRPGQLLLARDFKREEVEFLFAAQELEVKVRAGGMACLPYIPDQLALRDPLPGMDAAGDA